ncbi:siderophore-interacting protein [Leucobacter sp. GX24907]
MHDAERGVMRTYTVRAIRPEAQEIDIDFVLHGIDGPASAWATGAQVSDELIVLGPDGRSQASGGGVEWQPGAARTVLLAGDETAVPAIAAILESLESSGEPFSGSVCLEIPDAEDALDLRAPAGVEVVWLPRSGAEPVEPVEHTEHGVLLDGAARARAGALAAAQRSGDTAADTGAPGCYVWLAGEAGVVTGLRRHLVRDLGIDRRSITFMGYWRKGRSEPN